MGTADNGDANQRVQVTRHCSRLTLVVAAIGIAIGIGIGENDIWTRKTSRLPLGEKLRGPARVCAAIGDCLETGTGLTTRAEKAGPNRPSPMGSGTAATFWTMRNRWGPWVEEGRPFKAGSLGRRSEKIPIAGRMVLP
jgi:hypothetical protein